MSYDVIIAGAGLAGSVAARELAEKGKKILITERLRHTAGHCHDYRNDAGITIHSYGPHIFHTTEKKIWQYVNRFSGFRHFQHRVLSYAAGQYIKFPINRDTICDVFGVSISTAEVEDFLKEEVKKSAYNDPPENFRDVIVSQVGEFLYEMFFKNYTIKQWERDPEELSPEVAKRIPVRGNRDDRYFSDPFQGIPEQGYTKMIENILDHKNITLVLGADYFEHRELFSAPLTIYTGKLDRFFDYKYGELEYRSLRLEFKTIDSEWYQKTAVVNYPNDYQWTRITEFKHFLGEKSDKTTILFEYPEQEGEPYYVVMTKENIDRREKYMTEVEKLEESGKFLFLGRLAEYKYYNMDQIIKAALDKVQYL